jgi:hypothetical protein
MLGTSVHLQISLPSLAPNIVFYLPRVRLRNERHLEESYPLVEWVLG